jgi:hypothetical protein
LSFLLHFKTSLFNLFYRFQVSECPSYRSMQAFLPELRMSDIIAKNNDNVKNKKQIK